MQEFNNIVIADTSVIINFLNIDKIDLLCCYPGRFFLTEHVIEEVTKFYIHQYERLQLALYRKMLNIIRVDRDDELILFSRLSENAL